MNSSITDEIKNYIDLRISAVKLQIASKLSSACGNIISLLVILFLVIVILALVGIVLMQYLDDLLGEPWGALIVLGMFVVLLVIAILMRKTFLKKVMDNIFSNALNVGSENLDADMASIDAAIKASESQFAEQCSSVVNGIAVGASIVEKIVEALKSLGNENTKQ